jgi:hypothetical protein
MRAVSRFRIMASPLTHVVQRMRWYASAIDTCLALQSLLFVARGSANGALTIVRALTVPLAVSAACAVSATRLGERAGLTLTVALGGGLRLLPLDEDGDVVTLAQLSVVRVVARGAVVVCAALASLLLLWIVASTLAGTAAILTAASEALGSLVIKATFRGVVLRPLRAIVTACAASSDATGSLEQRELAVCVARLVGGVTETLTMSPLGAKLVARITGSGAGVERVASWLNEATGWVGDDTQTPLDAVPRQRHARESEDPLNSPPEAVAPRHRPRRIRRGASPPLSDAHVTS